MVSLLKLPHARACTVSIALMLSAGCTSLYQVDCSSADWFSVGLNDGTNGVDASRSADHKMACETSDNLFDTNRYQLGHENGLQRYCTTESGLVAGLDGRAYRGVCTENSEKQFLSGYLLGASSRRSSSNP